MKIFVVTQIHEFQNVDTFFTSCFVVQPSAH